MEIDGITALVTGGASGLGRATAEGLVLAGARVVVADLPGSDGEAVEETLGSPARFVPTDVTSEDDVAAALDVAAELGDLRVVVCCAGVATPGRVVGSRGPLPLDRFETVVRVNLVGTFNVVRLAAARMAAFDLVGEERGVVVTTASIAAYEGQVGQVAYAASKAGVAGMTLPLARDLAAAAIRVVSIAPGTFATPMVDGLSPEAIAALEATTPHPARLGRPDEYAALVRHIVANPMLNGEVVRLDGALRMPPR